MQAIQVKFLGPSNVRGSRRKAWCDAGQVTVSTDFALNAEENARKACEALRDKLGWHKPHHGDMVCGVLPNGDYVFVFRDDRSAWAGKAIASLRRCTPWLARLIADGGHSQCANPQDAVAALNEACSILNHAPDY